jgi:hypothetical protein
LGATVEATDGSVGSAHDFLFDDSGWPVRYLVVDTGTWLPGRQVLVSPQAFREPAWESEPGVGRQVLPVDLDREKVKNSPEIHRDQPVSRQMEQELFEYYAWVPYWGPAGGAYPMPAAIRTPDPETVRRRQEQGDRHLRSAREVEGYRIHAVDGEIGHVEDFIVDAEDWLIRYLVVDTRNWLPGRKVLVSTEWVQGMDWAERSVTVNLQKESVKEAPPFDPTQPVNPTYEKRLYDFYGRPVYWTE